MAISASDIKAVVQTEDDFRHELLVGAVLRKFPVMTVEHAGTYSDSVTGKPRQFDFRCAMQKKQCELRMAIECKNLNTSCPLIVCGIARTKAEGFHDLIVSGDGTKKGAYETPRGIHAPFSEQFRAERSLVYGWGDFVGKNLFRVQMEGKAPKRIGDGDVYDKWAQALSSAVDLTQLASKAATARNPSVTFVVSAVLPIVVVPNETLWFVRYNENGAYIADPEVVDTCELFVSRDIRTGLQNVPPDLQHSFTFSHVHFLTLKGLESFLPRVLEGDLWMELFGRSMSLENLLRSGSL